MATAQKNEQQGFNEKLHEFMQKYRRVILFGFLGIVVVLFALVVGISLRDRAQARALSQVDELNRRYEEIKVFLQSEEPLDAANQTELSALLEELDSFTDRGSGFPAARAYNIIASIHWDQEDWAEAEIAWSASARAASRSYLAPVSFFNAAVAAEEQGNAESAIALYNEALEHGDSFPAAARAQFSVGRLYESLHNRDAALEAYRILLGRWPNDPVWSNLAQNRILILSE